MGGSGEVLKVGKILGAFGIKGWVKVRSDTDPVGNLLDYSPWYLLRNGRWEAVEVAQGSVSAKGLVARLRGCEDRNMAETLAGIEVGIAADSLPALPAGEFYWHELTGFQVVNADGALLGVVDHLFATGANDVIAVKPCAGSVDAQERLVPWVRGAVVQQVERAQRRIVVDWGLDW